MLRRELLQQHEVMVVTKLLAQQFEFIRHRAHFRRPGRMKQAEIIPEVFNVLPPFMKIYRQRFSVDKFERFPAALVTLPQSRFNRCPADRLDFQIANPPVCFA